MEDPPRHQAVDKACQEEKGPRTAHMHTDAGASNTRHSQTQRMEKMGKLLTSAWATHLLYQDDDGRWILQDDTGSKSAILCGFTVLHF